jgi:hypothetical protein
VSFQVSHSSSGHVFGLSAIGTPSLRIEANRSAQC